MWHSGLQLAIRQFGERLVRKADLRDAERSRQITTFAGGLAVVAASFAVAVLIGTAAPAEAGCVWRGTAPFCSGHCRANEIQIKRQSSHYTSPGEPGFGSQCSSGKKALCCTRCPSGLVWREKTYLDVVCVTPAERAAAKRG